MTLNQLSDIAVQNTGDVVGFCFKSTKTQKTFKAIFVSPKGMFLISDVADKSKEFLVDGTVDRYEGVGDARTEEIESRLSEIANSIETLEIESDTLNRELKLLCGTGFDESDLL